MAAKKRGRGPQGSVKGFRPGKEPTHLKRQRAKAELGKNASWAQKQTVEAIAGRSPTEVRTLVRRWSLGLASVGVLTLIGGVFLYPWSMVAGGVVHAIAALCFFLAYRIRKQAPGLEQMADSLR